MAVEFWTGLGISWVSKIRVREKMGLFFTVAEIQSNTLTCPSGRLKPSSLSSAVEETFVYRLRAQIKDT
ncbi:hypothetical protein TorRG33x02_225840, partial [Trema orientale]